MVAGARVLVNWETGPAVEDVEYRLRMRKKRKIRLSGLRDPSRLSIKPSHSTCVRSFLSSCWTRQASLPFPSFDFKVSTSHAETL